MLRIDAARAKEQQPFNLNRMGSHDNRGLNQQVVPDELGGIRIVCVNASNPRSCQKYMSRPFCFEKA
jgi:hypothetical protein